MRQTTWWTARFPMLGPVVLVALLGICQAQTIGELSGSVELRPSVDDPWRPADAGETLSPGGSLRTLQGEVHLALDGGGMLRLASQSELERQPRGFALLLGRAHVVGDGVVFQLGGPFQVNGEARFDSDAEFGTRGAVLAGEARATVEGSVLALGPGEQLSLDLAGVPNVAPFFERDPWYRDRVSLGQGEASVLGLAGTAEVERDGVWAATSRDETFGPGMAARTGVASWLELRFEDGSLIRLQAQTQVRLEQREAFADAPTRTLLTLERGKIWAVVEDEGQTFEIETPGLVAGVRGTTFRLDAAGPGGDEPLIKTFDGLVFGITGFEAVPIEEGEQFDPERGLEPLVVDELDEFNLLRDLLATPPSLTLAPVASVTDAATLTLSGETEAGVAVAVGSDALDSEGGVFSTEVPLRTGFNLLRVTARRALPAEAGGDPAPSVLRAVPVIRTSSEPFLLLAPISSSALGFRLAGVASPGAVVEVVEGPSDAPRRRLARVTADAAGRFVLRLPAPPPDAAPPLLIVTDPSGRRVERSLDLPR